MPSVIPPKPDPAVTTAFLEYLYGAQHDGVLAISSFPGPTTKSFDLRETDALEKAIRLTCDLAVTRNTYFCSGLLKERPQSGRGKEADVIGIAAGHADVDFLHPVHAATDLPPTPEDARWLIAQFGPPPSLLANTGHGFLALWVFRDFWQFGDDPACRAEAKQFTERLQTVLRRIGAKRKWRLDPTADLCRLMRPGGSINFKDRANPLLVTYEITGQRYNRADLVRYVDDRFTGKLVLGGFEGFEGFEGGSQSATNSSSNASEAADTKASSDACEDADSPKNETDAEADHDGSSKHGHGRDDSRGSPVDESDAPVRESPKNKAASGGECEPTGEANDEGRHRQAGNLPPAKIGPILNGCAWMRHCRTDAKTLSEPEWYAEITVLCRCEKGEQLVHKFSHPHPNYSSSETQKKLEHALKDTGPITCDFVAERLGQQHLCEVCPSHGKIRSPIVLGSLPPPSSEESWPDAQPLSGALPDVMPFDPELLTPVLRGRVVDVSQRLLIPLDFAAATMLVALGGAVERRAFMLPLKNDDSWVVTPNLWGAIIGRPGLLKSPCIDAIMAPLNHLQALTLAQHKIDMEEYQRALELWDAKKGAWKKQVAGGKCSKEFEETKPERPTCPRFIVNDSTIEKMQEILQDNPQGVLYLRDELAGFFATLDSKGRERDRPFFLESWNGNGPYVVDRIGRGTIHIPHLCLSVFGSIQPARLQTYLSDAVTGGATDDGLMQRLQVLVWPDHSKEWRLIDRTPDHEAALAVDKVFERICKMLSEAPFRGRFSPEAQELFNAWRSDLENRIRREKMPAALESHLAKYRKLMPAISLLLHLAESGEVPEVPLRQAQRAAAWTTYLESHARRVYSCVTALSNRLAADLGEKLKQGKLGAKFRLRDVYLKGWSSLDTAAAVELALPVLEDAGWIRRTEQQAGPQGGRPRKEYCVNPKVYHG